MSEVSLQRLTTAIHALVDLTTGAEDDDFVSGRDLAILERATLILVRARRRLADIQRLEDGAAGPLTTEQLRRQLLLLEEDRGKEGQGR